ncbi:DUF3887 domain-containing protein [Halorubrum salinarum]|uniref:DUF3887 domain-containing protein n=1 Tax=Halorubrum salinarum TaxID=2739057 RepID=A0A7D3YNX1_9EURY|nr:DUF3887 domain-containing protein [Halorubrum salinarum]QKG93746.1 DUF3887 domain-containing protein [Halorubrum salinarum]
MNDGTQTTLTRRGVLAVSVAGATALAGCSGLGLGGDFEFPDGDPSDAQKQTTRTFVTRVHDGEYEAASEPFTEELAGSLPPDRIESVWAENVGDLGAYERIGAWGIESRDGNDAVFARVECANGHYALQLTLAGERIGGVFIRNVAPE